jgi:hypothetical protein
VVRRSSPTAPIMLSKRSLKMDGFTPMSREKISSIHFPVPCICGEYTLYSMQVSLSLKDTPGSVQQH